MRKSIAAKVSIGELVAGRPVTDEKGQTVAVETRLGQISRANVVATVIDLFQAAPTQEDAEGRGFATLTLDDGTGVIRAKVWGALSQKLADFHVGDLVLVIGRLRSFQNELNLNVEIVRRLDDPNWETVRLLELVQSRVNPRPLRPQAGMAAEDALSEELTPPRQSPPKAPRQSRLAAGVWQTAADALKQQTEEAEAPVASTELRRVVLQTIDAHNKEGGARFEQILAATGEAPEEEIEQVLIDLLSEGVVYEPEIHRYKRS
jgi:DNA polymerase III alpha subunit